MLPIFVFQKSPYMFAKHNYLILYCVDGMTGYLYSESTVYYLLLGVVVLVNDYAGNDTFSQVGTGF